MAGIPPIAYTITDGNFGSSSGVPYYMTNYSKIGKVTEGLGGTFSAEDVNFIGGESVFKDPVVFPYMNGVNLRVLLANYKYVIKHVGTSDIWLGNPSSGWNWESTNVAPPWDSPLSTGIKPPRNIYAMANWLSNSSVYFGDWDNGPLPYPNESTINLANISKYNLVISSDQTGPIESLEYVSQFDFDSNVYGQDEPLPAGYLTHVSDVRVYQGRLFVLVNASDADSINYLHGRLVEMQETNNVLSIKSYVSVDKNAFGIVPGGNVLFVPCVGGQQNYGSGNGVNSSICAIDISNNGLAVAKRPFKGGNSGSSLDFRGMVVSSTEQVFILCGNYLLDARGFDWAIYKTTLAAIMANLNAETVLDPANAFGSSVLLTAEEKPLDCYYWTLGITNDDYVIFTNTAKNQVTFPTFATNYLSFDRLSIFPATARNMNSADIVTYQELRGYVSSPDDPGLALSSVTTIDPTGNIVVGRSPLPPAGGQHFHGSSNFAKAIRKVIQQQSALLK
jgi:hypothetical protein